MVMLGLGIVFLMVEKPGWLGSAITLVMALLAGVILTQALVRADRQINETIERADRLGYGQGENRQ